MSKAVFCLVRDEDQAVKITDQLKAAGISNNAISVLFSDKSGSKDFAYEQHTKAPEGTAAGVGTGGLLGGILGWLTGAGVLVIPGLGPLVAAGPLIGLLSGAGAGAAAGGLVGALIGMGIPEYEAKRYEGKVKEGNILISVHTKDQDEADRVKQIFEDAGARDISIASEAETVEQDYEKRPVASSEPGNNLTSGIQDAPRSKYHDPKRPGR